MTGLAVTEAIIPVDGAVTIFASCRRVGRAMAFGVGGELVDRLRRDLARNPDTDAAVKRHRGPGSRVASDAR